jgi:hypothetical protein
MKLAETELRHFVEDKRIVMGEDLEQRAHDLSSGIDACIATVLHICRPLAAGGGDLPHVGDGVAHRGGPVRGRFQAC